MKRVYLSAAYAYVALSLLLAGCNKKSSTVWDDQQTAGKFKTNFSALWGNSQELSQNEGNIELREEEFIPLNEEDLQIAFADRAIAQPAQDPGELSHVVLDVENGDLLQDKVHAIFSTLHFNTDDHILRGEKSLAALDRMASYLKEHPHIYLFIEGHCDERGPEAYNLSLGTRRANHIRSLLVNRGVDANRLHTISYGKEKPVALEHNPEAWKENRRAQFKLFNRS